MRCAWRSGDKRAGRHQTQEWGELVHGWMGDAWASRSEDARVQRVDVIFCPGVGPAAAAFVLSVQQPERVILCGAATPYWAVVALLLKEHAREIRRPAEQRPLAPDIVPREDGLNATCTGSVRRLLAGNTRRLAGSIWV